MLNFVKTSANLIECFTNIRRSMPTSAVCLSTMERSIPGVMIEQGMLGKNGAARSIPPGNEDG